METYEKIRKLREDANLKQEEVALATGIPRSSYAKFEQPGKLNQERLQQIADFYKIDVSLLAPDETYIKKLLREQGHTEPTPTILEEPQVSILEKEKWLNSSITTNNELNLIKYYRLASDDDKKLIIELAKKLGTK